MTHLLPRHPLWNFARFGKWLIFNKWDLWGASAGKVNGLSRVKQLCSPEYHRHKHLHCYCTVKLKKLLPLHSVLGTCVDCCFVTGPSRHLPDCQPAKVLMHHLGNLQQFWPVAMPGASVLSHQARLGKEKRRGENKNNLRYFWPAYVVEEHSDTSSVFRTSSNKNTLESN